MKNFQMAPTELQKNGQTMFAVSECKNAELVVAMYEMAKKEIFPTTSCGISFDTKAEIEYAYNMLSEGGVVRRTLGPLPWSVCSADVLDKYGVYWYIYM